MNKYYITKLIFFEIQKNILDLFFATFKKLTTKFYFRNN